MQSQKYTLTFTRKSMLALSLLYLLSFAAAELIISHVSPIWGIFLYPRRANVLSLFP